MSIHPNHSAGAQCDDDFSAPTHSANDFDRIGWTRLDCICADAKSAGKAVQFDPHGTGFVQCDEEGL